MMNDGWLFFLFSYGLKTHNVGSALSEMHGKNCNFHLLFSQWRDGDDHEREKQLIK